SSSASAPTRARRWPRSSRPRRRTSATASRPRPARRGQPGHVRGLAPDVSLSTGPFYRSLTRDFQRKGEDESREAQAIRPPCERPRDDHRRSRLRVMTKATGGVLLLVEDDDAIGRLVKSYLEQQDGWQVVWLRSGEEAVAELRRHPVRFVVLDIGLPGIDGF